MTDYQIKLLAFVALCALTSLVMRRLTNMFISGRTMRAVKAGQYPPLLVCIGLFGLTLQAGAVIALGIFLWEFIV